jgi:quinol-cytochrome oxidoreductase complex cytochrome b subunit
MINNHLSSIYYIPWVLVLLAIIILIPLLMRMNYLDRKSTTDSFLIYEYWHALLLFPTFTGGVGVVLTVFSIVFSYTQYGDPSSIRILLPLCLFCFIFTLLAKLCYTKLKKNISP